MRKSLSLTLVLALGLAVLLAAGCSSGGSSQSSSDFSSQLAKAQSVTKAADAAWAPINTQITNDLNTMTTVMTGAIAGNASAVNPQDVSGITASLTQVGDQVDAVKAQYQQLLADPTLATLKGPDQYVVYAKSMVKALASYKALLTAGAAFLGQIEPMLVSGNIAGVQAAVNAALSSGQITQLQTLMTTAQNDLKAAQDIQAQQKLSP